MMDVENRKKSIAGILFVFIISFVFWAVLSTFFDPVHLSLGILCSLLVAYYSYDLLVQGDGVGHILGIIKTSIKFIPYFFWLVVQIIKANIDVVKIVLDPKLPISPRIIKFGSDLPHDVALTILANSITLTPGTLTMDIDEDKTYYIHCLAKHHGDALLKGDMQSRVGWVFGGQ
jgi:multicomponent Na+:H+ antiporter subunit E